MMNIDMMNIADRLDSERMRGYCYGQMDICDSTGCPTKNVTLFWRAVAPLNFELGIKVGGVLESSGSQL